MKKLIPALGFFAILIALAIIFFKEKNETTLHQPLANFESRPKLLTFGMYVTPNPEQNPIDPPERFTGYHSGLDIEILPEELDKDVPVYASCDGDVVLKENSNGYGGVLIQACSYENNAITVLYGHLDLASIDNSKTRYLRGEQIGLLGDHKTEQTSFTRKHLHFSIHRGNKIELRGYVQTEEELSQYLNPELLLSK